MAKSKPFYRFECEKCGAPLIKNAKGEQYKCEYCGAIYLKSADEEARLKHSPVSLETASTAIHPERSRKSENNQRQKKPNSLIIIGFILFSLIICVSIFFLFRPSGRKLPNTALDNQKRPKMLSALPDSISAGEILYYDYWEFSLDENINTTKGNIFFKIYIKNWHENSHVFRYTPATLEVYDNLGNNYSINNTCNSGEIYLSHQITFDSGDMIELDSREDSCSFDRYLPAFHGVIPIEAEKLYLKMTGFGVIQEIFWVFDL